MHYPFDLDQRPPGFEPLSSEPVFDPSTHLQLEEPEQMLSLSDLGYPSEEVERSPTEFAATSVFRVLSEEGAACLLEVCKQLEAFTTSNERIARNVRGGVYRSRFLRELCLCEEVTAFMGQIAGLDLLPHTIPHQLGHLNYNPKEIGQDVDKWHVDTLRYDYVMFVTDPTKVEGGAFQYFKGTKEEFAALKQSGSKIPAERIIAPRMPGPGYAIFMQGNMVVHQAKGLTAPGERITMVNGYVPADAAIADYTRYDQLVLVDPAEVATSEYARHIAFEGQRRLAQGNAAMRYDSDRGIFAAELEEVAKKLTDAAAEIRKAGEARMEHFGE